jgi:hypothetical protein
MPAIAKAMIMPHLFTFATLVVLGIATGYVLLTWGMKWKEDVPFSLRIGASYFIGVAFYISLIRTLATVLQRADLAVWITLSFSFFTVIWFHKKLFIFLREFLSKKTMIYVMLGLALYAPLLFTYLYPRSYELNDFSHTWTLPFVRYSWFSNLISECKFIPVIGQNYGQSILSFMGGEVSGKSPYLFLLLWFFSSIVFLGVFFYGFINLYEKKPQLIFSAVLVMLFGGTALSLTHVIVIDTINPLALCGYTDVLFGVFSVFMLLLFYTEFQKRTRGFLSLFVVVVLITITNFFTAPQNIIYLSMLAAALFFHSLRATEKTGKTIIWVSTLAFAALVAIPQGGMLTPKFMQSGPYPALLTTFMGPESNSGIRFFLGTPFHINGVLGMGVPEGGVGEGQLAFLKEVFDYMKNWKANLMPIAWITEQIFFTSIRVLFFPIMGILALFFIYKRGGNIDLTEGTIAIPTYKPLWILGASTFIIGFFISFTFKTDGYKWELIRLLIPGVTFGMLGFSLWLLDILKRGGRYSRYLFIFILCFVLCGPLWTLFGAFAMNISYFSEYKTSNFQAFFGKGPEIDHAFCSEGPAHMKTVTNAKETSGHPEAKR